MVVVYPRRYTQQVLESANIKDEVMARKKKTFDAVRMKRQAQAKIHAITKGMTREDELAYYAAINEKWRKRAKTGKN